MMKSARSSISRCWRVDGGSGMRVGYAFKIRLLFSVAASIAVSELVESGHLRIQLSAFDHRDQAVAIQLGLAQIRAIRHLIVGLAAVARPSVTGLAVSFLLIEPHAIRKVRRVQHAWCVLCARQRCEDTDGQNDNANCQVLECGNHRRSIHRPQV